MSLPVKVKKYGGTSVGSVEQIRKVAGDLVSEHHGGVPQLVVVSAMAKTTDQLMSMALQVAQRPRARELDMLLATGEQVSIALLAMAVHDLGVQATALTGAQCGIMTDGNFARARIQNIETGKLNRLLEEKNIVIVAGFQGITTDHEITTLGRGGIRTVPATGWCCSMKKPRSARCGQLAKSSAVCTAVNVRPHSCPSWNRTQRVILTGVPTSTSS